MQEHGSSLALSIAALMAELAKTQKERAEGERYRRALPDHALTLTLTLTLTLSLSPSLTTQHIAPST